MKIARTTSSTLCIFLIKFSEYVHQTLKYSTYEQFYALVMLYRIANVTTSSTLCIFLIKFSEYVHQTLKYPTYEQFYALVMLYRIANVFIFGVGGWWSIPQLSDIAGSEI